MGGINPSRYPPSSSKSISETITSALGEILSKNLAHEITYRFRTPALARHPVLPMGLGLVSCLDSKSLREMPSHLEASCLNEELAFAGLSQTATPS